MPVPEHQIRTNLKVFRFIRGATVVEGSSTHHDIARWDIVAYVLGRIEQDLTSTF